MPGRGCILLKNFKRSQTYTHTHLKSVSVTNFSGLLRLDWTVQQKWGEMHRNGDFLYNSEHL